MKKILSFALILCLAVLAVGCGGGASEEKTNYKSCLQTFGLNN